MSVIELKQKIHHQVDMLTDAQDIEEMYETMNFFFGGRTMNFDTSSKEITDKLQQSLERSQTDKGISTSELKVKMQEWLIK